MSLAQQESRSPFTIRLPLHRHTVMYPLQDLGHATAIQDITRQLAELVYGGRRGVKHKGWAPADAETIRWMFAVSGA